ncbi:hypothetical protein NDU88_002548 [Pleurodeles waltl]|uniref:Uncharacterized protein n=1 Tax=Pleurodeles waltl TaxID=8319 RepID=A0AAV7UXD7_PLEWA|nr:hypothetical protein NDU88_002548 [Pleurodeles waltl]
MEAGLDSILRRLRRLRLLSGGSARAGGGAASGGGRLQLGSCSLGRPHTVVAGSGSGPTVSGAGGNACGGACGGDACGAGRGAGAVAASGGGRLQPFSSSLRRLPTGDAAADRSGGSRGAGGEAGGSACGGAAGGAACGAGGGAGASADGHQGFTCILCQLKRLTLADGVVPLALSAGGLEEALLGGSCSLSLLHGGPFFTLAQVNVCQETFFRHTGTGRWRGLGSGGRGSGCRRCLSAEFG